MVERGIRKKSEQNVPAETLKKVDLPLVVMRPISTEDILRRMKTHNGDVSRFSLTEVVCVENCDRSRTPDNGISKQPVLPMVNVPVQMIKEQVGEEESEEVLTRYRVTDRKSVTERLRKMGLNTISQDEMVDFEGTCVGVLAPPLYTTEGKDTFIDASSVHKREKEGKVGKSNQNDETAFIRAVEVFHQQELCHKIYSQLPPDLRNSDVIDSAYVQLSQAVDPLSFNQAYGRFMSFLKKYAGKDSVGSMQEMVATAWDEVLFQEQLFHYLKNPIQAPLLVAQLPVFDFSEELRNKMLEHPNATYLREMFAYIDRAMKPNFSIYYDRLPQNLQDLFSNETEDNNLLSPELLKRRIAAYRDLKLDEGQLPHDVLLAFKSWQEHIMTSLSDIFKKSEGERVTKEDFGEHVNFMQDLYAEIPEDSSDINPQRKKMKQRDFISQPDELLISAYGLDPYTKDEDQSTHGKSDPDTAYLNRLLLLSFPLGYKIRDRYKKQTVVSSFPWRRVNATNFSEGIFKAAKEPKYKETGFSVNYANQSYGTADFGDIHMEKIGLGLRYMLKPIDVLRMVRNKRPSSYLRKVIERGTWNIRDIYAASYVVDTTGPNFQGMSQQERDNYGNRVIDFLDDSIRRQAESLGLTYIPEEFKDQRYHAGATGGSGASTGGYPVMKYYSIVDSTHPLGGTEKKASPEQVAMEVCYYPSVEAYRAKVLGEGGKMSDKEYARQRWLKPADDTTETLMKILAPQVIPVSHKNKILKF